MVEIYMSVVAKWRDHVWQVTTKQVYTLSNATWNDEFDTDDKQRKASEATFEFPLYQDLMPEIDIADEIITWRTQIGKSGYLYVGGSLFGAQKKYVLTDVDVSNVSMVGGEIAHCDVSVTFTEDLNTATQALPKRKRRATSSNLSKIVNVYRFYNRRSGLHMWTTSSSERSSLQKGGWTYEGVAFEIPCGYKIPVFRLYNPRDGNHLWTTSAGERDGLKRSGWNYEGVGWYSDDSGEAVYRLCNPKNGDHMYTFSAKERDGLKDGGWTYEGVAFWI